jgi:cell division transport system ATP-binding protein
MIHFERVSKKHVDGTHALRNVSVNIMAGELVFITGHSGAGKSTFLRLIALLERVSAGELNVLGRDLGKLARGKISEMRRQIGLVFQDHRLLMDRTVFDNVALPLVVAGFRHQEISARVAATLDRVGLKSHMRKLPVSLSGGEQQRVGIARAIVAAPPLILADEPTGNLDPALSLEIMQLFVSLAQGGQTVIIASHDLPLVQRMRQRALVLQKGELIDDFRPHVELADG